MPVLSRAVRCCRSGDASDRPGAVPVLSRAVLLFRCRSSGRFIQTFDLLGVRMSSVRMITVQVSTVQVSSVQVSSVQVGSVCMSSVRMNGGRGSRARCLRL